MTAVMACGMKSAISHQVNAVLPLNELFIIFTERRLLILCALHVCIFRWKFIQNLNNCGSICFLKLKYKRTVDLLKGFY